ncbi:pentapeptide repeat-containing protein, partial [Escherichia coli]
MRDAFFEISKPFTKIETEGDFYKLLDQARHINNIMYMPNKLLSKTIVSVTFENVSFSKTDLKDVTFKNCIFKNCLFISSIFDNVRFHSCSF